MVQPMNDVLDNESWQCRTEDDELLCSRKMAPNRDGRMAQSFQNQVGIRDDGTVDLVGTDTNVQDRVREGRMVISTSRIETIEDDGGHVKIVVPR